MPKNRPMDTDTAAGMLRQRIREADGAIYALRQRERTMMPRQFQRELQQARQQARETIAAARQGLADAVKHERQETMKRTRPTADEAARITMHATRGMALTQAGMRDLEAGVRDALASGDRLAAQEYLRAGGSRLQAHMREHGRTGEFRTLQSAAQHGTDARRAATLAALDHYEQSLSRLDTHLRGIPERLGNGDVDPVDDTPRHDPSEVVARWQDTAHAEAVAHGEGTLTEHAAASEAVGVPE